MAHIAGVAYCPRSQVMALSDFGTGELHFLDRAKTADLVDGMMHDQVIVATRIHKLDLERLSAIECTDFRGDETLVVSAHRPRRTDLLLLDAGALLDGGKVLVRAQVEGPRYVQGLATTTRGALLVHHNVDLHDGLIEVVCLRDLLDGKKYEPHQRIRTTAFPEDVAVLGSSVVYAREWSSAFYEFDAAIDDERCSR